MELEVNDIVLFEVEKKFGRFSFLESINETKDDEYSTESFCISKDLILTPYNDYFGKYKLLKVWRLDPETDNYIRIYPEHEKEASKRQDLFVKNDEKHRLTIHDVKPADVPWDKHHKVLQENDELKEIIINLNKEINKLKKGA